MFCVSLLCVCVLLPTPSGYCVFTLCLCANVAFVSCFTSALIRFVAVFRFLFKCRFAANSTIDVFGFYFGCYFQWWWPGAPNYGPQWPPRPSIVWSSVGVTTPASVISAHVPLDDGSQSSLVHSLPDSGFRLLLGSNVWLLPHQSRFGQLGRCWRWGPFGLKRPPTGYRPIPHLHQQFLQFFQRKRKQQQLPTTTDTQWPTIWPSFVSIRRQCRTWSRLIRRPIRSVRLYFCFNQWFPTGNGGHFHQRSFRRSESKFRFRSLATLLLHLTISNPAYLFCIPNLMLMFCFFCWSIFNFCFVCFLYLFPWDPFLSVDRHAHTHTPIPLIRDVTRTLPQHSYFKYYITSCTKREWHLPEGG